MIVIFLFLIPYTEGATTFFSYGSINGDQTLARANTGCAQVNLNFNFSYYGNIFTNCCINIDGYIVFDYSYLSQYLIAPFKNDLTTVNTGNIYYRLISYAQSLNQIGQEINSLKYLNKSNFIPTNAFIVTWDTVPSFLSPFFSGYVSFQIILSTDGLNSFLTINYGSLGFGTFYGYYFQYGSYFSGYYTTISINNPELSSNVGVNGKWIYNLTSMTSTKTPSNSTTTISSTSPTTTTTTTTTTSSSTSKIITNTTKSSTITEITTTSTMSSNLTSTLTTSPTSSTTTSSSTTTASSTTNPTTFTTTRSTSTLTTIITTPTTSTTSTTTSSTTTETTTTSTSSSTTTTSTISSTSTSTTSSTTTSSTTTSSSTTAITTTTNPTAITTTSSTSTLTSTAITTSTTATSTSFTTILTTVIEASSALSVQVSSSADLQTSQTVQSSTLSYQATSTNVTFQISNLNINQLLDIFTDSIDTNNCLVNCSQNGLCSFSQSDNKFICACNQYFTGPSCSFDTRPCTSNPCLNQGKCIQNLTNPNEFSFHCNCSSLFEGNLCEYKKDVCINETCSGNGNCVDFNNKPKCICFSSYEGDSCETMNESLKSTKKVISTASIIAICFMVCLYLIFLLLDIHRIFIIKNKVFSNTLKWNHRILHQNYNFRNKKTTTKRKNVVGITYLDYIE